MKTYYNEIDPFAAQWLRNLINAGHLPSGDVDERSIVDVKAEDLKGYKACHFFAGIGGWAYALRLAGWPEDKEVWTGSPPCQPFSVAGKRQGVKDERHLAPKWLELIAQRRPATIFGEQVSAAIKKDSWLDNLLDALEDENYATGAIVLPACSVGAPHIRQRLWFVADSSSEQAQRRESSGFQPGPSDSCGVGYLNAKRCEKQREQITDEQELTGSELPGGSSGLGDLRYMQQAGLIAKLAPGLYAKERKKRTAYPWIRNAIFRMEPNPMAPLRRRKSAAS